MIGLVDTPSEVPELSFTTLRLQRLLLCYTTITAVIEITLACAFGFPYGSDLTKFNFTATLALFLVYLYTAFLKITKRENHGWVQLLSLPSALVLIIANIDFYVSRYKDEETWGRYKFLSAAHIYVGWVALIEIVLVTRTWYKVLVAQGTIPPLVVYAEEVRDVLRPNRNNTSSSSSAIPHSTVTVDVTDRRLESALEVIQTQQGQIEAQQGQIQKLTELTESLLRARESESSGGVGRM